MCYLLLVTDGVRGVTLQGFVEARNMLYNDLDRGTGRYLMLRMLVDVQLEKEIDSFRARIDELQPMVVKHKNEFAAMKKRCACLCDTCELDDRRSTV
eukprot:2358106-Pyramimonas_sp.AAC.1